MADDEGPPEITPWGERDEPDKLFGGFWWVSAERHGGLYLTAEQREAIPESLKGHSRDGDGIWWEENSAWSLPVMCLLSGRPESSLTEGEQENLHLADQTCRDEYPREWEHLTGRRLMPGESRTLDGEIEERHGFDGSGPLPGGTRFHTLVLAADEDEQARNAGRVHMQVVHAGDEGNEFTKTYAVPAPITREFALVENKPENLATWLAGKGCKLDCEDGPAVVERRPDGEIRETWYRDGHWHRTDGPALVERTADGSTLFEDYFLEGGRVAKEDVVFPERDKFNALVAAAGKGETAAVNHLLHSGANIHGCDDAPLRTAALHGHGEAVRALVLAGAKVGAWDEMALRCMVHRGDTETVKFLLEKGAHIFAIEDKVVEEIERQGGSELAKVLRDAEAARMAAGKDNPDREVDHGKKSGKQDGEPTVARAKDAEAEPLKSQSEAHEPHRDRARSTVAATELTVHTLLEDPWLVLDHPLPDGADPQLLKAARAAAVVCRYEAEDLIAHDSKDPHARDLKKIDAIFTDIRHRLGEPELEGLPLEPEMEKTLNELEKNWKAQPQKQHDRER
jgi:hypothetical protein